MDQFIHDENQKIRSASLWRSCQIFKNTTSNEILLNDEKYINFSSNDYLGYSHHPQVVEAGIAALNRYGSGGRSSRLISGTLDLHVELEEKLAKFKQFESCILFPTGFMANLGVISALLGEGDAILIDRYNHASMIDATKLAKCRVFVYEHCSVQSFEKVLERTQNYKKRLVVTDALFSMDGDFAPLNAMVRLCQENKVWLMIDDAHATGVFGNGGIGMSEYFNLLGQIEIVMGTLSKALASQGGFVCGKKELVEFLVNRARTFIFTTALSPVSCAAASKAIDLIHEEPERRKKLLDMAKMLRDELKQRFSRYIDEHSPDTQIIPFKTGSIEETQHFSEYLKSHKIIVPAIRPPTVPKDQCRLRFSLTADHTENDIQQLLDALKQYQLFKKE